MTFRTQFFVAAGFAVFAAQSVLADAYLKLENPRVRVLSVDDCKKDYATSPSWFRPRTDFAFSDLELAQSSRSKSPMFLGSMRSGNGLWAPDGAGDFLEPAGCSPDSLERAVIGARSSVAGQKAAVDKFFATCGDRLRKLGSTSALADLIFTTYEICDHPRIRKVIMKLDNGEIMRGFLGIKPGEPRPLVVAKSGVFSDTGDTSQRFMMMHLFDESPFHVLMLSSSTGSDFVTDNKYIEIGGVAEGQQLFQAADLIKQTTLVDRISDVHVVAVSLGSNGALFSSYLNDKNVDTDGNRLFASTFVISPVADLKASVDGVFKDKNVEILGRALFNDVKSKVIERDPALEALFPSDDIESTDIPDYMAGKAVDYLLKRGTGWFMYPFSGAPIKTISDYWKVNDFVTLSAKRAIRTPTFAIAATDDPIVKTNVNTQALEATVAAYNTKHGAGSSLISTVTLPRGSHCAFNQVYGWRIFSALLRSYVISRSPEMLARRWRAQAQLPVDAYRGNDSKLAPEEAFYMPRFEFKAGDPMLYIRQEIFTKTDPDVCTGLPLTKSQRDCLRESVMQMPIAKLDHRPDWVRTPQTAAEAESLTRWANANIRIVNSAGKVMDESREAGTTLRFISYE